MIAISHSAQQSRHDGRIHVADDGGCDREDVVVCPTDGKTKDIERWKRMDLEFGAGDQPSTIRPKRSERCAVGSETRPADLRRFEEGVHKAEERRRLEERLREMEKRLRELEDSPDP
jgi:hypothetical protein